MSHPRRAFIDEVSYSESSELHLSLSDQDSHHFINVLRLKPGDGLTIVCKTTGKTYSAELLEAKLPASVRILQELISTPKQPIVSTLCLPLLKGKSTELACEKATELGVESILLWQAERSVKRWTSEKKIERWQKAVYEAAKQSGNNSPPEIIAAEDIQDMLSTLKQRSMAEDTLVCCSLSEQSVPIASLPLKAGAVHLILGPEGDFSPEEQSALIEAGFSLVNLGNYTLKAETAAIAGIAIINALMHSEKSVDIPIDPYSPSQKD